MASRKPKLIERDLREDFAPAAALRVDREKGIIFRAKILGTSSPNKHGLDGITGTDYPLGPRRAAAPLYEGMVLNVDHPDRDKPNKDRSSRDRLGVIRNSVAEADGSYGDLHLLTSHPMSGPILEAAEKMPEAFALSHNAFGRGVIQGDRYVINEIADVRSVDVVAHGGTVKSLFESQETAMQIKLSQLIESRGLQKDLRLKRLLEMDDLPMDAPPTDASSEDSVKAAFSAAIRAVAEDDSLDVPGKMSKLKEILKAQEAVTSEPESKPDSKPAGDDKPKETSESKQLSDRCVSYCKLAGIEAEAPLLESLAAIGDETKILKFLEHLKDKLPGKGAAAAAGDKPRSQAAGAAGAGSVTTPLQESSVPKEADQQLAWLRN